ncbi:DHH subfamily 1 protein [Corynebacterium kutscheri]|uniref:hypothetical protein n=1 Tax=Corynebacterium kutscheri TaxID=35755 RepID=UPI000F6C3BAB|nr:hypothetical protein [Corynebacterium kutscheri]VEH79848.1 DHH subfamily 1 protein [Corynebacterium kutscheri]
MLDWTPATARVDKTQRIVIVGHINPNVIGSVCALGYVLSSFGKQVHGVIGQREVFATLLLSILGVPQIECIDKLSEADLVNVVDYGAPLRTGLLETEILQRPHQVMMFDDYRFNQSFADSNMIGVVLLQLSTHTIGQFQEVSTQVKHDIIRRHSHDAVEKLSDTFDGGGQVCADECILDGSYEYVRTIFS